MQLIEPFDATKVDPSQGGGGLPVGKYPVRAINSEIKSTSAGDSGMLVFELEVLDGPNKGQTGTYRLNIYNSNQQAKDIANKQLSALCHVTGVFNLHDSAQLHGIPFVVDVQLQKGEEAASKGYTEVKKVFDINGNEPGKRPTNTATAQPQQQQPQASQPASNWQAPATGQPAAGQQPSWGAPAGQPAQPQQQPTGQPTWGSGGQAQPAGTKPAWAT